MFTLSFPFPHFFHAINAIHSFSLSKFLPSVLYKSLCAAFTSALCFSIISASTHRHFYFLLPSIFCEASISNPTLLFFLFHHFCFVAIKMASPNTAEQNKPKSSDGLTIFPTTSVCPKISPFEDLMMASTPAAESSARRNHLPFDVFISHHGQDTKHTLASSIYTKLDATGLRVFLDKNELKLDDLFPKVLKNAIASASVHIVIFSENYAKSPWCMAELSFMLTLQTKVTFIPIFYHVDPSTVRWAIKGKGIYANAFEEYEKKNRHTQELQIWKWALYKASLYSGEIINKQCDEEAVVKNVVNCILKELKKVRLDVANHPVGLDEAEQDFEKIALQSNAGPIQIVGIWGMGGAGKTTLAKHLFNKKCFTINRSSFLLDVREAASRGRLHEKQKKLLKDLNLNESANFDNIDEGKEILRSRLRSVFALIVLDDVDHKDQLDALLPARDNLDHRSLIIVTSRELCVLGAWNISAIYKISPLNRSYAKELFSWHAFGQPSPFIDFKELAEKLIDACCGLPLSLKVLGGLLYGEKSKNYWESQLDKLSRIMPNDIKSRLKISYDALDNEEREMFLDAACFFIGWTSNSAIAVWDGSQWSGMHGWQRLVNKCLVELDVYDNKIRMHDHLRDLGREIANKQSPYRLWCKRQIIEIQPQQVAIQIRGMADAFGDNCYIWDGKIKLNTTQGERVLAPGSVGLKIFIGGRDFINKECSELSRELLCFRCDNFVNENLPSWLPLKKLKILELGKSHHLEDLWECDEHAPLQLRHLRITEGYELKKISALQKLRSLETLTLRSCEKLTILQSLLEATSLKEIDLLFCRKLEKIESLEGLRSLEKLSLGGCEELNTVSSLAEATSLKMFSLYNCNKLEKIEGLEGLISLETLKIGNCGALDTVPSLAGLTSLKMFHLYDCYNLEKIESLEGLISLQTLKIHNCLALHAVPCLAELTSLEEFEFRECWNVDKIEGLEVLRSLKKVKVHMSSWRPCMLKLPEQTERLKSVEVVANRLVVDEASIREIQKWPREEIICTKIVIDVMSLRNFFTSFLPEDVVEGYSSGDPLELRMPESAANANANAILICFILDYSDSNLFFQISTDRNNYFPKGNLGMGYLGEESIWVWMGIFPQESNWLHSKQYKIEAWGSDCIYSEWEGLKSFTVDTEVKEGWLLRSTEQSIRKAFCRLCGGFPQ